MLFNSSMSNWVKKNSLDEIQRAFQQLGINCGKLLGNILDHRADHRGPGNVPFPPERGHFHADSPPAGFPFEEADTTSVATPCARDTQPSTVAAGSRAGVRPRTSLRTT